MEWVQHTAPRLRPPSLTRKEHLAPRHQQSGVVRNTPLRLVTFSVVANEKRASFKHSCRAVLMSEQGNFMRRVHFVVELLSAKHPHSPTVSGRAQPKAGLHEWRGVLVSPGMAGVVEISCHPRQPLCSLSCLQTSLSAEATFCAVTGQDHSPASLLAATTAGTGPQPHPAVQHAYGATTRHHASPGLEP